MGIKHDVLSVMRNWAPEDTAESWDNVGLQVDTLRDIDRIALVLELNLDTWDVLQQYNYDFIISHHPLIFKPFRSVGYDDWSHQVLRELIKKDIGFYVSHTNLDRASDGVTDVLMRQFELDIIEQTDIVNGYGKLVSVSKPIDIIDIEDKVPVLAKIVPDQLEIQKVALCGGSGKSFTQDVIDHGADLYITGELGYHDMQALRQQKVAVMLLGHYQSEAFVLDAIQQRLDHLDVDIDIVK
tara:strand:+ start:1198 stop:1917 length:720 start_codon:yes stop_codon:yes gene_type:complete